MTMKQETVQRLEGLLEKRYPGRPRKPALGAFLEDLIWPILESDELQRKYGPYLEEYAVDEDKVVIKDNRSGAFAELRLRNGVLWCCLDKSDRCVHIGFAWAIPSVYRIMSMQGTKKPTIRGKRE